MRCCVVSSCWSSLIIDHLDNCSFSALARPLPALDEVLKRVINQKAGTNPKYAGADLSLGSTVIKNHRSFLVAGLDSKRSSITRIRSTSFGFGFDVTKLPKITTRSR